MASAASRASASGSSRRSERVLWSNRSRGSSRAQITPAPASTTTRTRPTVPRMDRELIIAADGPLPRGAPLPRVPRRVRGGAPASGRAPGQRTGGDRAHLRRDVRGGARRRHVRRNDRGRTRGGKPRRGHGRRARARGRDPARGVARRRHAADPPAQSARRRDGRYIRFARSTSPASPPRPRDAHAHRHQHRHACRPRRSHYPFEQVNKRLEFDRDAARGFRLDLPAGATLRWGPGETREVTLVRYGGTS